MCYIAFKSSLLVVLCVCVEGGSLEVGEGIKLEEKERGEGGREGSTVGTD